MSYITNRYGDSINPKDCEPIELLCGATAHFDTDSGISYRCDRCMAVVGSIGMPNDCKELYDMEECVRKLKGIE
jgi:hypothetical protein